MRIRNDSGQELLVAYDRFRLVGADGRIYRALPLFRMEGSVPTSLRVRDPFAIRQWQYGADRFEIAPFYAPVYPGADPFDGPFAADPSYYGLYDTYYGSRPLPTTEMRRRALPEGVLRPGGFVEGYLFFEEMPSSADRVTFQYDLLNPQTRGMLGDVRIPYVVG